MREQLTDVIIFSFVIICRVRTRDKTIKSRVQSNTHYNEQAYNELTLIVNFIPRGFETYYNADGYNKLRF